MSRSKQTPFSEASYRAQVRRLRLLAKAALDAYPFRVAKLDFIHHGENATFKVTDTRGRCYLLRILRADYHSLDAITEELSWLARIAKTGLVKAPSPVKSRRGRLVEQAEVAAVPQPRYCCVFRWIEGRFINKGLRTRDMHELGALIGKLQNQTLKTKVRHRRYWTAEGLVGKNPKFGSIDTLKGVRAKDQLVITRSRKQVLRKLRRFEMRYPSKLGLIHTDLHFGNVLRATTGRLCPIDFDDCGLGFHAYDLVAPLISAEAAFKRRNRRKLSALKQALVAGYSEQRPWTREDDAILPYLYLARRLTMLGWLNARWDNPRLRRHMKGAVHRTLKRIGELPTARWF